MMKKNSDIPNTQYEDFDKINYFSQHKSKRALLKKISFNKLKLIFGFLICSFIFLGIMVSCVNQFSDKRVQSSKNLYFELNNHFIFLNKEIKKNVNNIFNNNDLLISSNEKILKTLQLKLKQYSYLDHYILVNENFKLNHFFANNSNQYIDRYKTSQESKKSRISKVLREILQKKVYLGKENRLVFFKDYGKNSIFYMHSLPNNQYLLIHFNHLIFEDLFNQNIRFIFEKSIGNNSDIYKFPFIKNIDYIEMKSEMKFLNYFRILLFNFFILYSFTYVCYLMYRGILKHNNDTQELISLNTKPGVVQNSQENYDIQMQSLINTLQLVPWTANPKYNIFTSIGEQVVDISGIPIETWLSKGFWLTHIHQDDRDILFKAINSVKEEKFVSVEYRIFNSEGDVRWLRNMISERVLQSSDDIEQDQVKLQGLIVDITDEKRVIDALEGAKIAAEKANKMKTNFLSSMSHELRTPLNSIIGFSEIIHSLTPLENDNISEYSINILDSAKHLLSLINDILDYSKIEAGEFTIHLEPTPIFEIFNSCQFLLEERARKSNLSLIVNIPPDDLYLNIDALRIKQVLINLLTNAIKFNRPNGKVALMWQINDNNEVILSVMDTGIGIKGEDLKYAFDKFRQIDDNKNRQQEGTGLGLSISKSLVELHGGKLEINSVYGKGTKVSIILPPSALLNYEQDINILNLG